ncbi:GMP synthase [glutamine-hydrolyzing] [Thalassovita gelatinovora]|uniref:GMP synthase [glutamine-hydrolyzing] n=1 Tax=Thalassovita gelatinovora TaxID=53501 RepID=A0A0P1F4T4_THAGE|nr:glutamine amidotransferase [Thalassovita gelatinovora]QIZ79441.1 glutamine amidotransferase [Thalassovita gelatinovora]CUH62809.1 GMP synthase [glutamine-hydrolyzing] [Thalassovita gelatinovora]SEQ10534.1 GMP synthase (glutamine-hydrolysing) [Thalassovita gelatinovora]
MPKPFLLLQLRPETEAADDEYAAFLRKGGLDEDQTHRIRLDQENLPDLDLTDYAGVIVGGGPGCVSDPAESKDPTEARIEDQILSLMPRITEDDIPFLGCCYGIGILGHHLKAEVSKKQYGEPVGAVECTVTDAGKTDPLMQGVAPLFGAFVGHKEALQELPVGGVHLLRSTPCPFQMVRFKSNVYATQFHPEADSEVFELRIRLYKDKGYFHPDEAETLVAMCRAANVTQPEIILRNFVTRYGQ